jgi:4-oxalocrotonate tautomerase
MPIVTYSTNATLTNEDARLLAVGLTDITREHLRKDPAVTVVKISSRNEFDAWFVAGDPAAEPQVSHLSIQITEGRNTVEEKAAWLRAAAELLGIRSESIPNYLTITEIPDTDWGFNGITQTARRMIATT